MFSAIVGCFHTQCKIFVSFSSVHVFYVYFQVFCQSLCHHHGDTNFTVCVCRDGSHFVSIYGFVYVNVYLVLTCSVVNLACFIYFCAPTRGAFLVYPAYIVSVSGTVFAVVIQK